MVNITQKELRTFEEEDRDLAGFAFLFIDQMSPAGKMTLVTAIIKKVVKESPNKTINLVLKDLQKVLMENKSCN